MSEKKILNSIEEILTALRERLVFAEVITHSCGDAANCNCPVGDKPYIVRDARLEKDNKEGVKVLKVKLLEGWRRPDTVYVEM